MIYHIVYYLLEIGITSLYYYYFIICKVLCTFLTLPCTLYIILNQLQWSLLNAIYKCIYCTIDFMAS